MKTITSLDIPSGVTPSGEREEGEGGEKKEREGRRVRTK